MSELIQFVSFAIALLIISLLFYLPRNIRILIRLLLLSIITLDILWDLLLLDLAPLIIRLLIDLIIVTFFGLVLVMLHFYLGKSSPSSPLPIFPRAATLLIHSTRSAVKFR